MTSELALTVNSLSVNWSWSALLGAARPVLSDQTARRRPLCPLRGSGFVSHPSWLTNEALTDPEFAEKNNNNLFFFLAKRRVLRPASWKHMEASWMSWTGDEPPQESLDALLREIYPLKYRRWNSVFIFPIVCLHLLHSISFHCNNCKNIFFYLTLIFSLNQLQLDTKASLFLISGNSSDFFVRPLHSNFLFVFFSALVMSRVGKTLKIAFAHHTESTGRVDLLPTGL